MWTTDGLTCSGGWDLISFIFFGFVIYKACTKSWRELIFLAVKKCFEKPTTPEDKKVRLKYIAYVVLGVLAAIFLVGTWFASLIGVIKEFI